MAVMTDGIRGCGSDDKRYKWHICTGIRQMAVGVVAVMTKEMSGTCIRL